MTLKDFLSKMALFVPTQGLIKVQRFRREGEPRLVVSETGAITISTCENQNINLRASGSGKVSISGLDLQVYGVKKEVVSLVHEEGQKALTVLTPSAGSMTIHVSGETEGGLRHCRLFHVR